MQIEMINGYEAVAGEAIVLFEATDKLQRQTFVNNAICPGERLGKSRALGPTSLNMFHIRSKNMNTRELLNTLSKLAGVTVRRAELGLPDQR